jgi:hypothetical protein
VARAELKDVEVAAVMVAALTAPPGALAEPEAPPAATAMQTARPVPAPPVSVRVPPASVRVPAAALAWVPMERRAAMSPLGPAVLRRAAPVPSTLARPAPSPT